MYQDNNSTPVNRGRIRTLTAAGALTVQDNLLEVDATGGSFEVALPAASEANGFTFCVKKIDTSANVVTLNPSGVETIDGELTAALSGQWQSLVIESDGVGWLIAASNTGEASPVLSGNIAFTKEAAHSIFVQASTTANTAGGALSMVAGAGVGTGAGGAVAITGGAGGTGAGGAVTITGGAPTGGNANGGAVSVIGGAADNNGTGGAASLHGGASPNAIGGGVSILGGNGGLASSGGAVNIDGGTGSASGGGAVTIGGANAELVNIGRTGKTVRFQNNIGVGGLATLGTGAAGCIGLPNTATRPSTSVDMVQLYGTDIAAGAASLGIESEEAVAAEVIAASTHVVRIKWNNVMYKILLSNV